MAALPLREVRVTPGPAGVAAARAALEARMAGDGPPFTLIPQPSRHVAADYVTSVRASVRPEEPVEPDDAAVVLATSGSTGDPRGVIITRDNLRAAVESSWERLPGLRDCAWVLALPVTSIGGFATVARSHLGGTSLHAIASVGGAAPFRVEDLLSLDVGEPFAISLVPTQLADVLGSTAGTQWLARASAVLVGGAATAAGLAARAREAGIALVTTYGMTETTGGCVYDGLPLPGVEIVLDDDGRLTVEGPQVAAGYRTAGEVDSLGFSGSGRHRRFRTGDLAHWDQGRLRLTGRIDDVVTVHGVNVALGAVESVVRGVRGIDNAAVVAVPDDRQGNRLLAFVTVTEPVSPDVVATAVAEHLGRIARPEIVAVDHLPSLPNGKIDRRALRATARDM